MQEINFYSKSKEYGWLSNFYSGAFCDNNNVKYKTVEHYYQSRKASDMDIEEWIRNAPTPYLAMKSGRALRPEKDEIKALWDDIKENVMFNALSMKFSQNEELKEKLLATGDAVLHEDSPTDMFWGKKGEDKLGKLLMQVRNELRGERQ
jgi:ribA/ribD-fused uncharacterized protein